MKKLIEIIIYIIILSLMVNKICNKCRKEKGCNEFFKSANICKSCFKEYSKNYYYNNKESCKNKQKEFRNKNKIRRKIYDKKYYELKKNDNHYIIIRRKYRGVHREKNKNYARKYYIMNREKCITTVRRWQKKNKEYWVKMVKKNFKRKYKNNIEFKILVRLRSRMNYVIKNNVKSGRTIELLGCSVKQLKIYLENQFQSGMTWKNHGSYGWHIDHIIPCGSFDLSKESEQKKCFHFSNLQPLWAKENYKKGSKIKYVAI